MRHGYGELPDIFTRKNLSKGIVEDCGKAFIDGATKARDVVNRMGIPKDQLKDPRTAPQFMLEALKKVYPQALEYSTPRPGYPDRRLLRYLEEAAQLDLNNGGDGDAAAFLDEFGNLLICAPGHKNKSPIRTMEMIRAYTRLRYDLTADNNDALYYLHEPKHVTIVLYKGFDKSAASFADLGAYGSTILGTLENDRNLLYCKWRIRHNDINFVELICSSKSRIWIFCSLMSIVNENTNHLCDAVNRNVELRTLGISPNNSYVEQRYSDLGYAEPNMLCSTIRELIIRLQHKVYTHKLLRHCVRLYNDVPAYSFFLFDNLLIISFYFKNIRSKDGTHLIINLDEDTEHSAGPFLQVFQRTWAESIDIFEFDV